MTSTAAAATTERDTQHNDALLDALERLEGSGAEFEGYLANHGPMAADALSRLGAPGQVARWVDAYRDRLDAEPASGGTITEDNWRHHLGDIRLLGDWTTHFETAVRAEGWRHVLATWWPRLLPGAAASATHGLIRTAHAVRSVATLSSAHPLLEDELARGLAYWAARYQLVPGAPTLKGAWATLEAIRRLPRLPPDSPSVGPGIAGRIGALVGIRSFPDALDAWGVHGGPDLALDELISAAARVVANREDAPIAFCHTVTAPAAVQMVLQELPEEMRMPTVAVMWQVVGAIITAYGWGSSPHELTDAPHGERIVRSDLAAAAIDHGDEHVIKLTEAALRQYARTGDSTLLVAADRFRHRLPPIDLSRTPHSVRARAAVRSSVVINVEDFDGVMAFYRDVLQLPVRKSWEAPAGNGMIIEVGPTSTIEFVGPPFAERIDPRPVQGVEVMVGVDDAAAWLFRLTDAGVTIQRDLIENPWGDRSGWVPFPTCASPCSRPSRTTSGVSSPPTPTRSMT